MKAYTSDGQYAATIIVSKDSFTIEGPFAEEIEEIVGKDRVIFTEPVERDGVLGDKAKTLPGDSVENVKEFLAYPKRWGYKT